MIINHNMSAIFARNQLKMTNNQLDGSIEKLSSGLKMVGDELDGPIAQEFTQVSDEVGLGLDVREALANLCHRIDVVDLGFFSTAVLIQRAMP